MTTAEGTPLWHGDVKRGFTRRCGKRDPVDKSPCMHGLGHKGRHAWEPTQTVLLAAPIVVGLRPERGRDPRQG
jgi:hypothetical protein